tara:strand:+ start:26 stop:622 length:597 start_codon:yes stop_codon:yes gene_type:complete
MNDFWKKIWDKKGNSDTVDLLFLDGYEHLDIEFSSEEITTGIINTLEIEKHSAILEVGCGCGFLSREFQKDYHYVGIDYSESIIKKHLSLFPMHQVFVGEANNLQFEDDSFDYVFCFGLFQYLPDLEYANQTINEMARVGKRSMFLGDLKNKKTRETHFVYPKLQLENKGFKFTDCFYDTKNTSRFNAYKKCSRRSSK